MQYNILSKTNASYGVDGMFRPPLLEQGVRPKPDLPEEPATLHACMMLILVVLLA